MRYLQQATKLYLDVFVLELTDLVPGAKYKITHPYGVDEIIADLMVKLTIRKILELVRLLHGALNSRIGTFLKWDPAVAPAPPAGYIGNPDIEHQTVIGGVNNQNFFQIEGPGIGNVYPNDRCTPGSY